MKYISLFLLFLLSTGCVSRGALTFSNPMEIQPTCPPDREVIYPMVSVTTIWDTEEQTVSYSWQCTKFDNGNDTYRVEEIILGHRKPEPKPLREHIGEGRR